MDVSKVIEVLEAYFPLSLQEDWDNSGLQISPKEDSVKGVLLALDISPATIQEAVESGCNLIVAHHPLLFSPTKKLIKELYPYNVIFQAIENNVGIYALHSNLDSAKGGLNDYVCERLELTDIKEYPEYAPLRIGKLQKPMSLKEAILHIKQRLQVDHIKAVKASDKPIENVAVCTGSCMDMIYRIHHLEFDLFLSGDLKHHTALFARYSGINVVDATHYHTEKFAKEILAEVLGREGIKTVISKRDTLPWSYE